jgi:putative mRNA 3-end processing factor
MAFMSGLLEVTPQGLYCPAGEFYIDPWQPVAQAVITHAHSDHARWGSKLYLTVDDGVHLLRQRVGDAGMIEGLPYGKALTHNGVRLSLHPAGHILGSCQIRIEVAGEVCVVSGDYKVAKDPTCPAFEPVRCHHFVSESTFGLPIYRWPTSAAIMSDINAWWRRNQERGRTSVIFAYALGKAQRVLAGLDPTIGPILVHGAVQRFLPLYRHAGVLLPSAEQADPANSRAARGQGMVLAPPSAIGSPWLKKFGPIATAMASGWMQLRGPRRRRAVDRGFVLSDHADWNGLLRAIADTGAERIWVTHGYTAPLVRWLTEQGKQAEAVPTQFEGEVEQEPNSADDGQTDSEEPASGEDELSDVEPSPSQRDS